MTPSSPHDRIILAAQGYLELGMFDHARKEIDLLADDAKGGPEALEILALSLMGQSRWVEALDLASALCELRPKEPGGHIHKAYCLHELGRTEEALRVLLDGPEVLKRKSVFFYNAGCYYAKLGRVDEAVAMLEKSFELDEGLRRSAKRDPDLVSIKALF